MQCLPLPPFSDFILDLESELLCSNFINTPAASWNLSPFPWIVSGSRTFHKYVDASQLRMEIIESVLGDEPGHYTKGDTKGGVHMI